jgi:hypothetical protein
MITLLARRPPVWVPALLVAAMLVLAALAAGLMNSPSAGHGVADNGVIHSDGSHASARSMLAGHGVITVDGIQGSG